MVNLMSSFQIPSWSNPLRLAGHTCEEYVHCLRELSITVTPLRKAAWTGKICTFRGLSLGLAHSQASWQKSWPKTAHLMQLRRSGDKICISRHVTSDLPPARLYLFSPPPPPRNAMTLWLDRGIHRSMRPQPLGLGCFQKAHQMAIRPSTYEPSGDISHQNFVYLFQIKCLCVINTSYSYLRNPYTGPHTLCFLVS